MTFTKVTEVIKEENDKPKAPVIETYYDQEMHDRVVITFKRLPRAELILFSVDELNL